MIALLRIGTSRAAETPKDRKGKEVRKMRMHMGMKTEMQERMRSEQRREQERRDHRMCQMMRKRGWQCGH